LRSMQEDVALFATGLLRLKAQVICTKFQPQTILMFAAADQMQPDDQQMIPQALALLKDNPLRNFRIEVAADSLVQLDEQQMKRDRAEFISALGAFLKEALPLGTQAPELVPMIGETMKFMVASFKGARSLEGAIDQGINKIVNRPPPQPQQNPEMMKMQAEQQLEQTKMQANMQLEQAKLQRETEIEQMRAQLDAQKLQFEQQKTQMEQNFNKWKVELESATKIMTARIAANPSLDIPAIEAQQAASEKITQELGDNVTNAIHHMVGLNENMLTKHDQNMNQIAQMMQSLTAPKRIVRGADGKAIGVEVVQ
jgi:hypothetical protein